MYYNPERELTIQCIASQKGLMQDGHLYAYASRAVDTYRKENAGHHLLTGKILPVLVWSIRKH